MVLQVQLVMSTNHATMIIIFLRYCQIPQLDVTPIDPRKNQLRRLGNKYPFSDPKLTNMIQTHQNLQLSRSSSNTIVNSDFTPEVAAHFIYFDCDTAYILNNKANPDVKLRYDKQDAREHKITC